MNEGVKKGESWQTWQKGLIPCFWIKHAAACAEFSCYALAQQNRHLCFVCLSLGLQCNCDWGPICWLMMTWLLGVVIYYEPILLYFISFSSSFPLHLIKSKRVDIPTRVRGDIEGVKIKQLACKSDCVLAVSEDGDLFGWENAQYCLKVGWLWCVKT